jgi:hypothetical protein
MLAIYREVPLPHEIVGSGNFMPRIATNAEALIDYALSHIPPSKSCGSFFVRFVCFKCDFLFNLDCFFTLEAGPRNSRRKKRMLRMFETKRVRHIHSNTVQTSKDVL